MDDGKEKENVKMGTINPEFFRAFEFQVTMPGESQLKIKVSVMPETYVPELQLSAHASTLINAVIVTPVLLTTEAFFPARVGLDFFAGFQSRLV